MLDWVVTIEAILEYLNKARQAQDKLDEANAQMERAANALLAQWEGDAANAFAEEQAKLHGFLKDLIRVGSNFWQIVKAAADKYTSVEETVTKAIQG